MANYGHTKVNLNCKKLRRVNTLSNHALLKIIKERYICGNIVSDKAVTEAKYIANRKGLIK